MFTKFEFACVGIILFFVIIKIARYLWKYLRNSQIKSNQRMNLVELRHLFKNSKCIKEEPNLITGSCNMHKKWREHRKTIYFNPIRLGRLNSPIRFFWGKGSIWPPPLKSRRWGQKLPRSWLHIDIWSIKDFISHLRPRYDKKLKNSSIEIRKCRKKSKIFGFKN